MSLPLQVPSHSSSPSKSSLRRTSGPQNPSTRSLLPSPHFAEEPLDISRDSPQPQDSYDEQAVEFSTQAVLPHFQPFFSLIEDPMTHEHHHPTVHYIFADDDAEIITEAACRSLDDAHEEAGSQVVLSSHTTSRVLPPPVAGAKEHYLVLDVQPVSIAESDERAASSVFEVTHAYSLSSEWQVLRTKITHAPTIGDSPEDEGLMLRIEGRGNTPPDADEVSKEKESLEEMIDRFQRRLEDVRLVMDVSNVGKEDERD